MGALKTKSSKLAAAERADPALTQEDISTRAYALWQKQGCPAGSDREIWQQAERELKAERASD